MIINKEPRKEYAEYSITENQRCLLTHLAEVSGVKDQNGTYWLYESVTNQMGLTPRHVSENFENIRIEVGDPHLAANQPETGKIYALTGKSSDRCIANGNSWKGSEVK
jgi:hypothetical protein